MIPDNRLSTINIPSRLLAPDDRARSKLVDYELGGIALNDPSQGLQLQTWKCEYKDGIDVVCTPEVGSPTTILSVAGITELSLTFDQNMRPTLAYMKDEQLHLWWWDTSIPARVTTNLGAARSPRLCLDDKRNSQFASSDIILAYMRDTTLYYRQQRDRFLTEYTLKTDIGADTTIKTIGMGMNWRLQIELG